jgi:hypothetical protein
VINLQEYSAWQLRCRFDFSNGRAPWVSQWDRTGTSASDAAWRQSKEGLMLATVEGKHRITRELRTFAQCAGPDFCNFEWLAAIAMDSGALRGSVTKQGTVYGLVLVTNKVRCVVKMDGSIHVEEKTQPDKFYHFGR